MSALKIGILGLGKMGEAIAQGLLRSGAEVALQATRSKPENAAELKRRLGLDVHTDNVRLAKECDVVVLAVKPFYTMKLLEDLAPHFEKRHLLLSVAAGLKSEALFKAAGSIAAVARAMPNTPCLLGAGFTGYALGPNCDDRARATVETILSGMGEVLEIPENKIDALTGVSGSSPAFFYEILDAMAEGGERAGLARSQALRAAAVTMMGAARMVLETKTPPPELIRNVATPGGVTVEGLAIMHQRGVRAAMVDAVEACRAKSEKLSKG